MTYEEFQIFFLIMMRIASFMMTSSLFMVKGIPNMAKIGFAVILSFLLMNVVPKEQVHYSSSIIEFGLIISREVLFGLSLGFITNLIFLSIQMAGQLVDFQIGFSMASYYDPMTGTNTSLYGRIYYWLGLVLFFTSDGHHFLLYGLAKSFNVVPLSSFSMNSFQIRSFLDVFTGSFVTAFQIALPILAILLLTDVIIGLLARTVPQLNIFILGMPLKVLIGILTTIILLPAIGNLILHVIGNIPYYADRAMEMN